MKKKIIIVTEKSGIIIRSLQVQLVRLDVDAVVCTADIDSIGEYLDKGYDNVLVDEDSFIHSEVYVYLKDCVLDERFKLFAMADTSNNLNITRTVPENLVKKVFYHPIVPREIAASLNVMCEEPIVKQQKILVFDHSESVCRIVSGWLNDIYDVRTVNKTINAFHDLVEYKPDVLIMDNELDSIDINTFWNIMDTDRELDGTKTVLFVDFLKEEPKRDVAAILSKETKRESFLDSIDAVARSVKQPVWKTYQNY